MAVFGGENWRAEWRIEQLFAPVLLFDALQVLEDAVAYLRREDYVVHEIDCAALQTPEAVMNDVLRQVGALQPDSTYHNIQGIQFWDLLRDANVPDESGLVLAFKHFDVLHREHPEHAQGILNGIASEHLWHMQRGRRFWSLAHCANRDISLRPVVVINAQWNRGNWDAATIEQGERLCNLSCHLLHEAGECIGQDSRPELEDKSCG